MTEVFSVHTQASGFPGQVFGIYFQVLPRTDWAIWCFLVIVSSDVDFVVFLAHSLSPVSGARSILHKSSLTRSIHRLRRLLCFSGGGNNRGKSL